MPEMARVLRFRGRSSEAVALNASEARLLAQGYLETSFEDRTNDLRSSVLSNPDALVALTELLRQRIDSSPSGVLEVATEMYDWLRNTQKVGLFDERDFFKGEAALLAGGASRHLGRRDDAARWLDRAEVSYRATINATPGLSRVAYARLSLRHEIGDYEYVLEFMPPLRATFEGAGMLQEAMKCCLLEAMALKQSGRNEDARLLLENAEISRLQADAPTLAARMVAEIGDLHQLNGETKKALECFSNAIALMDTSEVCLARADLKMFVGAAHWGEGKLTAALDAFRSSLADYAHLQMASRVAYMRLYIADTLFRLDRSREAEWELLAALPTIEEQKLVPEGFAAVALLKESVKRRKTDPKALRELREHLQASK